MLLGMGNPLLDITAKVEPSFLDKYNLKPNDAIIAEERHLPLYNDLTKNYKVHYSAGGSSQNSLRVAQWIISIPNVATFMGCIGKDKYGQILEEIASSEGVNVRYQYHDIQPTGTCAALLTNADRSLCANLGAANCFSKTHLDKPENKLIMENADFYYIAGFFLTVSLETILEVAKHACSQNKVFAMNLSAPFISQYYGESQMEAFPYVDIIFGNDMEFITFAKVQNLSGENTSTIALKVANLPKKNDKRQRMVVITQGEKPVIVAHEGKVMEFPVKQLNEKEIVDTNGAGDAFVGGFLAQLIAGHNVEECICCGIYAASVVIQQSGCSFPLHHNYK